MISNKSNNKEYNPEKYASVEAPHSMVEQETALEAIAQGESRELVSTAIGPDVSIELPKQDEHPQEDNTRVVTADSVTREEMDSLTALLQQMQHDSEITLKTEPDKKESRLDRLKVSDVFESRRQENISASVQRPDSSSLYDDDQESLEIVYDEIRDCFVDSRTGKCYEYDTSDTE
jgi:hypothetical protein